MVRNLPEIVFVLGGPGSGKSSQCQHIVQSYQFEHISAGQLLRDEVNRPHSKYKALIETHLQEGTIVPVEITVCLIKDTITRKLDDNTRARFLIDGFPRNQENLDGWNKVMVDQVKLLFVLFLDCSLDVCKKRCLARGEAGSGRTDDNLDSLQKRFNTYLNDSIPIIEYYKKQNLLKYIDATRSIPDVFSDIQTVFDSLLKD